MVNCSIPDGLMEARVCAEAEGGKGVNDVASFVMKFLRSKGQMKEDSEGKHLCVAANGWSGQNGTVGPALPMAEKKLCTFASCFAGDTKNSCDRWFNASKKGATKKCCPLAMEQLKEELEQD